MKNLPMHKIGALFALLMIGGLMFPEQPKAQLVEPEVEKVTDPKTPISEGYHNSIGFDIFLNNFGFAIGGHYGRMLGPYTELTFSTGITGIRDASEQTFQSFLTGQQIIPNKYKRAIGFPFTIGLKKRLFARQIEDSFRFYVSGGAGPAMAFTFPYLQDTYPNGFRDFRVRRGMLIPVERVNDFFTGWKNGSTHWGMNGELKVGVELGSSFGSVTSIEFGYFFYYFDEGLQIMEPYKPWGYDSNGNPIVFNKNGERNKFHDAQKYFGTPQIKFTFGWMW